MELNASELSDDQQAAVALLLELAPAGASYGADRTEARQVFDSLVELGWVRRVDAGGDEVGYCLSHDAAIAIGATAAAIGAEAANN
jgi:hypothetical protein